MTHCAENRLSRTPRKACLLFGLISVFLGFAASFLQAQTASGLFAPSPSFSSTNHLVSVSVFQWFTTDGGQLTGPWRPVEGRSNWTGTTNFWRIQIQQMMAANFDMLYVHLIPSSEQQRVNLFQALNQVRREGWNVPKVAPFLDPIITWNQQPQVNVATPAGKEEFVNQYIRWFNQYYSVNQDVYADDYLARIDGRPVLDTWHVKFNLTNLSSLTRADVESRLRAAFASNHPLFTNGIYMVTTALNDPTFRWADEKVPQFEVNEYSHGASWARLNALQLKGGYWDQNIRNPGDFLARGGGVFYSNAWNQVSRAFYRRVYVESWNEYDEGTGIYAANPGAPYVRNGSGNTNSDTWSATGDPYEYIKTTARGASTFNDWPERDAKILWHNLPNRMLPGETRTVQVIVRNEGDAKWSQASGYRFGQKEFLDPTLFGSARYPIDDTQDNIPTYGGIFRGRPKTFSLSLRAPSTPGLYTNHWSMLQGDTNWFGQELVQEILVDPTLTYHGAPQSIDSTALLTNAINDLTEHTYGTNTAVDSYADCRITRTFAAPIKSIKVSIVSGTADDVGYVGNILVTPDSANQRCQLGHVLAEIDVTSAVSVTGNTASLTLRARDTCCCSTGWGEDTAGGRANARLRWQIELSPPVPTSPVFANPANRHFYVLLSPATWTWSERAAAELGGHLATIRNAAEQEWVFNTLAGYNGVNRLLWIGLNDVATESRFVWSSKETVTFTNWAAGEPNNALTGEDFVTIYQLGHAQAGKWNDWGERVFDGARPFNGVVELVEPMGPPRIITGPQGGKVNSDAAFSFSVEASGSPTLRYQWQFNGTDILGATNQSLNLANLQFSNTGNYSVRITNGLGAALSSNATLIVNHPPEAISKNAETLEDTLLNIALIGSDLDGDSIGFELVSLPQHGSVRLLNQSPPGTLASVYSPDPNYFGPDSFTFRVNDGLASSALAIVSIKIQSVNDIPASQSQSLSVNEDTSLPITLAASDADGDPLTYTIVTPPNHGSWTATGPNVLYFPATNYFGPDSFDFKVNDGQADSSVATVSITVNPVNDAPFAIATISPRFLTSGASSRILILSANNTNASVVLDGTESWDVENDHLDFSWFLSGTTNPISTSIVSTNVIVVGEHNLTLVVSDGHDSGTTNINFEIIRPSGGVAEIRLLLDEGNVPRNSQPLYASLDAAAAAFERGNFTAGANTLEAFVKKVQAQVAPLNPLLAQELIHLAQQIITAVEAP